MTDKNYYSFIEQVLHYFDRPHEGEVEDTLASPAAWRGREMPGLDQLAYRLSGEEIAEIIEAVAVAGALDRPANELSAADFPLPLLGPAIVRWREELKSGRGFQVIRGVPVEGWSQSEAELFFWCLGLHLGRPGEQNSEGHLLGHVTDTGASQDDPMVRLYKTSANIDYHCDAADVVGLLCLNKAKSGGHSRIVSSVTVFNELRQRRPDLASRLFQPVYLDVRSESEEQAGTSLQVQPCCYADGQLRTFYHADYFRSVVRHADVPELTELEQELLDTYEAIASEPDLYLDMDLQPGDIQLLSNHSNLHARTDYVDHEDPALRRHLLRLWLSL
jgi:hypothetical protein